MAKSRKYFTINPTLAPGQTIPYPLAGNYLTCLNATAGFRVAFDGEDFADFDAGFTAEISGGFNQVWVENTSGSANTLKLAVGNGRFNDGRLTASGTVDVADPGSGDSFAALIAALREANMLRAPLTTLEGASYAEYEGSGSVTIVAPGANTAGVIIRRCIAQASTSATTTPASASLRTDSGSVLAEGRGLNGAGAADPGAQNIFVPAGIGIDAYASNTVSIIRVWYEVL